LVIGVDGAVKLRAKRRVGRLYRWPDRLPEAIQVVYPRTKAQLRIVHLVRNTLRYVTDKNRRVVVEVTEAERALDSWPNSGCATGNM